MEPSSNTQIQNDTQNFEFPQSSGDGFIMTDEQKEGQESELIKDCIKENFSVKNKSINVQKISTSSMQTKDSFSENQQLNIEQQLQIRPKKASSLLEKRKKQSKFGENQKKPISLTVVNTTNSRKTSDPLQKRITDNFNIRYDVYEKIGEGSASVVKRCRIREQETDYAVKIIKYENEVDLFNDILTEEKILAQLNHKNIIKKKFSELDREKKTFYLGMEYAKGVPLGQYLKSQKLNEKDIRKILLQIIQAVKHIHQNQICHKDLSYNNIIYNENTQEVKIIDFSISQYLIGKNPLFGNIGTLHFKAPEMLQGEQQTKQIDVWSIGVLLYYMIENQLPFQGNTDKQIEKEIISKPIEFNNQNISQDLQDLTLRFLDRDPLNRITIDEAINHPFIVKINDEQDFQIPKKQTKIKKAKQQFKIRRNSMCEKISPLQVKKSQYNQNDHFQETEIQIMTISSNKQIPLGNDIFFD